MTRLTMRQNRLLKIEAKIWVTEKNVKTKSYKKKLLNPGIKKSIQDWFNGHQGYYQGVVLLMRISTKQNLLRKLMKGETKRTRSKLIRELSDAIELLIIPQPNVKR
jgi:hypothetical protein